MYRNWFSALAVLAATSFGAATASAQHVHSAPPVAYPLPHVAGHVHGAPIPPGAAAPALVVRQYPYLGAPLYPCPRQDVPAQIGGTMITNQALAPHEMLYEHEYRGIYPPFYYRVKGAWWWTPFGIESHDKWELMGTEVKVKYRSNYALLSGFVPPVLK